MRRSNLVRSFSAIGIVIGLAVLPSCRQAPEEPQPAPVPTAPAIQTGDLHTILELPQSNSEIGVSLSSAPAGLVATLNEKHWLEVTDQNRPNIRYTFIANPERNPAISATSLGEFEELLLSYEDGQLLGSGMIETTLGSADWASGLYSEDGELLEEIYVFVPHPSGNNRLILKSLCTKGVSSIDERLTVMQELLTGVS